MMFTPRMRAGLFLLLSSLALQDAQAEVAAPDSASDLMYQHLLLSEDPALVRLGAQSLAQDGLLDEAHGDLVAEVLYQRQTVLKKGETELDTLSWLAKALGQSRNKRYLPFIRKMDLSIANGKFSRYAEQAEEQMTQDAAGSFQPGTLPLSERRAELDAMLKATRAKTPLPAGFPIQVGQTLEAVVASLGYPDAYSEALESRGFASVVRFQTHTLQVHYFDRGMLRLDYVFNQARRGWQVTDVWPDVPHAPIRYQGSEALTAHLVMGTGYEVLRKTGARLVRQGVKERALLDVMADRLWLSMRSTDGHEIDAMAYLCRVIGTSGDARYRQVLSDVMAATGEGKLYGYAEDALDELPESGAEPYTRRPSQP